MLYFSGPTELVLLEIRSRGIAWPQGPSLKLLASPNSAGKFATYLALEWSDTSFEVSELSVNWSFPPRTALLLPSAFLLKRELTSVLFILVKLLDSGLNASSFYSLASEMLFARAIKSKAPKSLVELIYDSSYTTLSAAGSSLLCRIELLISSASVVSITTVVFGSSASRVFPW